jgi:hypothetical protein
MISNLPFVPALLSKRQTTRSSRILLAIGIAAFLFPGLTRSGHGYALEGYWWHASTIPMRVQVGSSDIVLADGSTDFNSVVTNALELWNQQMGDTQFTWTVVGKGTATGMGDGVNSMQFASTVYGDDFGKNVLAITLISSTGNSINENDVLFNTANKFNSFRGTTTEAGTQGYFDLHRIALHELGHVLGLDHPDENGQNVVAIMNAYVSTTDSLQPDDVAGAVSLYGAPANPPPTTGQSQVLQISSRGQVETGDNVMIGGFIVQNSTTKKVVVRAIGPSLGSFGVTGALADPFLELHDGSGATIATNDDWRAMQEQDIIDTGLQPTNDKESAIVAELASGSYTAIVKGVNNTSGIALVEIYDLDPDNGTIANISTRAHIGTGDDVLIGGFILQAPQSEPIVVRALGPSLAQSGVTGTLINPMLEVYNENGGLILSNDNYPNATNVNVIGDLGLYPPSTIESAVYLEAAPGNYTAIVSGVDGSTGVGLVEIYGIN